MAHLQTDHIPDAPNSRWSLLQLMAGVFVRPYTAGHKAATRGMSASVLVHLFVLALAGFVLVWYSRWSQQYTNLTLWQALSNILQMTMLSYRKIGPVGLVLAPIFGELALIALCVSVLVPWTALNCGKWQQFLHGFKMSGYIIMWLLPVGALGLSIIHVIQVRNARMIADYLAWALNLMPILVYLCCMLSLRFARGYGDAIRTRQTHEAIVCEFCGYDLRVMEFDSLCPECGEPCEVSFSSSYRSNSWECGLSGYFATMTDILAHPDEFFKTISNHSHLAMARRFLCLSCIYSTVILAALLIIGVWVFSPDPRIDNFSMTAMSILRALSVCVSWAFAVMAVPLVLANLVHDALRRQNVLQGGTVALKICCYLSSLAVPGAIVVFVLDVMINYCRRQGIPYSDIMDSLRLPAVVMVTALCSMAWMIGRRGIRWLRWANR